MERHATEKEASLPVQEYAGRGGPSRGAVDEYVELDQPAARKAKDENCIIDAILKPKTAEKTQDSGISDSQAKSIAEAIQMSKTDWIHFGLIQAQAKSKTRWQTYAFVLSIFFVGVLLADIWLYMDREMYAKQLERVLQDFGAAKMKLTAANATADKAEQLQTENNQLVIENAVLKAQNASLSSEVESFNESTQDKITKPIAVVKAPQVERSGQQATALFSGSISNSITPVVQENRRRAIDQGKNYEPPAEALGTVTKPKPIEDQLDNPQKKEQGKLRQERIGAIRKGLYPKDMTKEELIAGLGEPDRIYKGSVYEQLVYFNHSPRRFWFNNGPFFVTSQ
jgi:hypothetical protein